MPPCRATGSSPRWRQGQAEAGHRRETKQYGKLPVMLVRMNLDLTMGDEVLKDRHRQPFMVFGEPEKDRTCRVTPV